MEKNCLFYIVYKNNRFDPVGSRRPGKNEREYGCRPFYEKDVVKDTSIVYTNEKLGADGICITSVGLNFPYIPTLMAYKLGTSQVVAMEYFTAPKPKATSNEVIFFVKRDKRLSFEFQAENVSNFTSNLNYLYYSDNKRLIVSPAYQSYGALEIKRKKLGQPDFKPYIVTLDHGQITVDPSKPYFDSSYGETGKWVDPMQPYKPFIVTLDHGQITVDPTKPYFDYGGETGTWVNPSGSDYDYPEGFN